MPLAVLPRRDAEAEPEGGGEVAGPLEADRRAERRMMKILRKWGTEEHPNIALSADERAWLARKHTVRVRIGEHPPWEIDMPAAEGMTVDYLRIIGKLFDIDFRFVPAEDSWIKGFEDMAGAHRHPRSAALRRKMGAGNQ